MQQSEKDEPPPQTLYFHALECYSLQSARFNSWFHGKTVEKINLTLKCLIQYFSLWFNSSIC